MCSSLRRRRPEVRTLSGVPFPNEKSPCNPLYLLTFRELLIRISLNRHNTFLMADSFILILFQRLIMQTLVFLNHLQMMEVFVLEENSNIRLN